MGLYISRQFVPETKLLPPMELKVGQRLYVQVGIVKYIVLHSSEWVVIEYVLMKLMKYTWYFILNKNVKFLYHQNIYSKKLFCL